MKTRNKMKLIGGFLLVALLAFTMTFNQKLNAETYTYKHTYAYASYTDLRGVLNNASLITYKDGDIQNRFSMHSEGNTAGEVEKFTMNLTLPNERGLTTTNYTLKVASGAANFDLSANTKDGAISTELDQSLYTTSVDPATGEIVIAFDDSLIVNNIFDGYVQVDYSIAIDEPSYDFYHAPQIKNQWGYNGAVQGGGAHDNIYIKVDPMNLRAVDPSGADLIPVTEVSDEEGDTYLSTPYTTTAPEIPGYVLAKTPANANGVFTLVGGDIIYEYEKEEEVIPNPEPETPKPESEKPGVNTGDTTNIVGLFSTLLGSAWVIVRKVKIN